MDAESQGASGLLSRRGVSSLHIQRACILTMNDAFDIIEGDVLIEDGRIRSVGGLGPSARHDAIDAAGDYLLPGFVQTHVHLCQTLFRGYADDRSLLDWLRTRIWPLEAAHTPASLRAATALAAAELLQGGTTSVLTMETVHDTDAVFEALEPTGLRAVVGKCMMDADQAAPNRLLEETRASIDESLAIARRWKGVQTAACARRWRPALRCPAPQSPRGGGSAVSRARTAGPHPRV